MNRCDPIRVRRLRGYFVLALIVILCAASLVVGQEPKSDAQAFSLDALDDLGKDTGPNQKSATQQAADQNSSGSSEFSLKMLDEPGAGDEGNQLDEQSRPAEFSGQSWTDNLRFTVDLSYRPVYSGRTGDFGGLGFVGIDLHKVFSDKEGDWGTLTLQTYLTRADNFQLFVCNTALMWNEGQQSPLLRVITVATNGPQG